MYEIMIQGPVQALIQVHTGRSFTDNCVLNEKAEKHLVARISAFGTFETILNMSVIFI